MTDVVLFHHVQGLTPGLRAFAADLAGTEHTVVTPDLFSGHTFATLDEGFAHLRTLDEATVDREVDAVVADLLPGVVVAGVSWGVAHAQRLAQTRPGVGGALLFEACFPLGDDGFGAWPAGLPFQVDGREDDEFFAHEGDLDAARALVGGAVAGTGEVFTYPGSGHLFLDSSSPSFDEASTALAVGRARELLARR